MTEPEELKGVSPDQPLPPRPILPIEDASFFNFEPTAEDLVETRGCQAMWVQPLIDAFYATLADNKWYGVGGFSSRTEARSAYSKMYQRAQSHYNSSMSCRVIQRDGAWAIAIRAVKNK